MAKVIVHTDNAPKSLAGYSQAIKSNGSVFVAGQGPFDAKTCDVVGKTIQVPEEHRGNSAGGRKRARQGRECGGDSR